MAAGGARTTSRRLRHEDSARRAPGASALGNEGLVRAVPAHLLDSVAAMSAEKDTRAVVDTGNVARRTYASLECAWGFRQESGDTVSIGAMERTYWCHVGIGKATAKEAWYERVEREETT